MSDIFLKNILAIFTCIFQKKKIDWK